MSAPRDGQPGDALVPAPALLDGLHVLEYGESAASAYAARLLGDLGATVTKIEPPGGSELRREGYTAPGSDSSALFAYTSAGKRSVTLDDTSAEGRETLRRLIAGCDVLIDSHRGSHWQELGIDFDALPGSGRCGLAVSITPFGRFGPHAEWAATHLTAHHAGGRGLLLPRRHRLRALPGRAAAARAREHRRARRGVRCRGRDARLAGRLARGRARADRDRSLLAGGGDVALPPGHH